MNVSCSNELDANDKVETAQDVRRSHFATKKEKKRRNFAASDSFSSQTVAPERLAKTKRKEPVAASHRRDISVRPSLKKKLRSKIAFHSPKELRQRKMVAGELTTSATFIGQPETMKQNDNSAAENAVSYEGISNGNLQLQATHREPTSFQNVGELLNANRPLPFQCTTS